MLVNVRRGVQVVMAGEVRRFDLNAPVLIILTLSRAHGVDLIVCEMIPHRALVAGHAETADVFAADFSKLRRVRAFERDDLEVVNVRLLVAPRGVEQISYMHAFRVLRRLRLAGEICRDSGECFRLVFQRGAPVLEAFALCGVIALERFAGDLAFKLLLITLIDRVEVIPPSGLSLIGWNIGRDSS